MSLRERSVVFMAFLLLLYDVGWSWPLFIVGGYRVFLQS